ncbi:UTP--glucose-1-phosphate uridylyltransferase [Clostridia bacterium]|nr:UTP--glucose-1-phosphate uridylyltransferase [Clostridia bacterium]
MKIKKAVIPAAGLGTRVLPATKALPKEMFPLIDKPAIQYIVEEAVESGITDILIILNRGKDIIEDHFDRVPELEEHLILHDKIDMLDIIKGISNLANIHFIRQKQAKGLGHAVRCAKTFVGNEPFAVLYGDDVIISQKHVCAQLIEAYNEYGLGVVAAKEMPREEMYKYGSLKVQKLKNNIFKCTDMIEKPKPGEIMSLYSILGRCILPAEIFNILDNTMNGVLGEIQLTDAMKVLAQTQGMITVDFEGKHYDIGNKLGLMKACVEIALNHKEIGNDFRIYLKNLTEKL